MKKLISALLAASMLSCGAGVLAEAVQPDSVVMAIADIEDADARIDALLDMRARIDALLIGLSADRYKDLERSMKGDEVTALQERLAELGYYTVKINGKYDNETVKAVKQFEKSNGLDNDGKASAFDQAVMFSADAINRSGSRMSDLAAENAAVVPAAEQKTTAAEAVAEPDAETPAFDTSEYEALDYADYAASPDEYAGRKLAAQGTVAQTMQDGIRLTVGDGQTLYVNLSGELELAIGDAVVVYGELNGEFSYKSVAGRDIILPCVFAHSVDVLG